MRKHRPLVDDRCVYCMCCSHSIGTCKNLCYRDVDSVVIQRINQCSNGKMSVFVDSVLTGLVCVCVCVCSLKVRISVLSFPLVDGYGCKVSIDLCINISSDQNFGTCL